MKGKEKGCPITSLCAFRECLASYSLENTNDIKGMLGFNLLYQFTPKLEQHLAKHKGFKFQACAKLIIVRKVEVAGDEWDTITQEINRREDFNIMSPTATITSIGDLKPNLAAKIDFWKQKLGEKETIGSGWVFESVKSIDIHVAKYKPLKASSYIPTPVEIVRKRAIVNVKNNDNECFKWAVLSALFPADRDTERTSKYVAHELEVDWSGIEFPMEVGKIGRFERRNNISINVYGYDDEEHGVGNYVLRKSNLVDSKHHIDLFLVEGTQQDTNHYCWIKHFSRFARQRSDGHKGAKQYCRFCLHGFPNLTKLNDHLEHGCREISEEKVEMPTKDNNLLHFKNNANGEKKPYIIIGDFECLTVPIDKASKDPSKSYTEKYQEHEPCGYCIHIVSANASETFDPIVYRGENAVAHFIETILGVNTMLQEKIKSCEPLTMSEEEEEAFQCQKECRFCNLEMNDDRVRDHDHQTGKYRGAAHSKCNINEGKSRKVVPVFFHNLKGYDAHLIVSEVGKYTSNLQAIPQNYEKFISFSFSNLRFLDSFAFLSSSLDTLVKNLFEEGEGRHKFVHTMRCCDQPQHVDLLFRKGVYPYDYMSDWKRMEETTLPPQEAFYSKLSGKHISDEDYAHAQHVWRAFGIQNLGEYHDLYVKTDVLLLADVFEAFREICLDPQGYALDPAHYFTTPNFAWDCMLKKTGVTMELLTDYDMYLMFEQGLRGGIAMISHRHAMANNPYLDKGYDPSKEHSYIYYGDANNLYGHSMSQALPIGNFKWSKERDINKLIRAYATSESQGCIVKCDLHYPHELHDEHNDYPLAPERLLVRDEMLSPYQIELKAKLGIGADTLPKLVPNFRDKVGYVCDIRNLSYYLDKGLDITKIHKVITFDQRPWMRDYITFNTDRRKEAKNEFEKDFYKLMSNSCFGKTMENLRERVNMRFFSSNSHWGKNRTVHLRTIERNCASPLYKGHTIYNNDLAAIHLKRKSVCLNKPIYAGMCILDLSKLHMFHYHYDVIKAQYGANARLLFTDTDSLCYQIKCDDFYKDMIADRDTYDLSNYPSDSEFYDPTNKKVLGKFKDETEGCPIIEFVGLRAKMYSLKVHKRASTPQEKKTGKGIQRAHLKEKVTHDDYRRCLMSDERKDQQQLAGWNTIRSTKHAISTLEINKVGLCCYDNKRWLKDDGIESLCYGHHRI